jgi:hypothetical protein
VFAISTAGEAVHRHDSILGRLIDGNEAEGELERPHEGLTISRNHAARVLLFRYESPSPDRLAVAEHKLANPASWITEEWLERQARNPELSDADYLQLHCNVWAAPEDVWLTPMQWAALADPGRIVADGEEMTLGFDGARHHDATALIGCTADGHLFTLRIWERPEGASSLGGARREVDAAVADAMERYVVRRAYWTRRCGSPRLTAGRASSARPSRPGRPTARRRWRPPASASRPTPWPGPSAMTPTPRCAATSSRPPWTTAATAR